MDETTPDVKVFNFGRTNTSNAVKEPVPRSPKFDPDALYYDMSGTKHLIILNQHTFKNTRYFKNKQPSTRHGTDQDVKSLVSLFEKRFGFQVSLHRDLDYERIINKITDFALRDHSNTSCIVVAIMTHGDRGGEVFASDRPYLLSDVISIFEQQTSLINKPKLFFVQACRGESMDDGNRIQLDSEGYMTIPTHADFLVLCSTVEDYLSYRDANGSWMIQALCSVLAEYHQDLDLLHMITLMNREVAYGRITYSPRRPEMHNKKQMPETRFTLTKLLKF